MAGFGRQFVDDVRAAGDIVRLVSEYVPLKPSGRRLKGLCPFHQEKTPSFSVDPERQLFYCFGCNTGGDIFKFLMLYEKMDFREAVEALARRFRVALPTAGRSGSDPRGRVLEMNRAAEEFFRGSLAGPQGVGCRDYLRRRGLDDETRERLGLGYAPDSWEALRSHLLGRRFRPAELVKGGLALPRKSGQGEYDRFRDRLVFPIRDVGGRTVAFGGRALGDGEPKYLNSPETPAYVKGEHLYGLDLAKDAIRQQGRAVVVEGYTDLAALVQAGIHNVVASLGTAFTPQQARLLARFTEQVVFSYDGDAAGATATARSVDLLLERGFGIRVVDLPGGQDPDDFLREHGAAAYAERLEQAPEYLEFLVQREARSRDLSRVDEQVAAVNAVLPHLARLPHAIERASWAGRLADALRIDDQLVLQELSATLRAAGRGIRRRPPGARPAREVEARLVSLLLGSAEARTAAATELEDGDLSGSRIARIVDAILHLDREGQPVSDLAVLDALGEEIDRDLVTRLAFRDEPEDGPTVTDCLWTLKRQRLARESRREAGVIARLQRTDTAPDPTEVDSRLQRVQELARRRDAMS